MEIPFKGEMSRAIIYDAIKLDKNPPRKIFTGIFVKCLAIILALLIVISGTEKTRFPACILIGVFIIDIWNICKWKLAYAKEFYDNYPKILEGIISEKKLIFSDPRACSELNWELFVKSKYSNSLVLIYSEKDRYCLFHRSWFRCDTDWANFVDLVKSKISL